MRKILVVVAVALVAVSLMIAPAGARNSFLSDVNSTCGTTYSCGLCHIDPGGGGPLTAGGAGFQASGNNPCYFCPNATACTPCTDADNDGYAVNGGTCGATDCNDSNLFVNPGAVEVCTGSVDDDCDGKIDCADSNCAGDPACASGCVPTASTERKCTDGIDNDCDGAVDCADSDCAKNRACK